MKIDQAIRLFPMRVAGRLWYIAPGVTRGGLPVGAHARAQHDQHRPQPLVILRAAFLCIAQLLPCALAPRASAQCMYDVTLIAPPACPGGGVPYVPLNTGEDMSETGVVVGWYEWCDDSLSRDHPFMWSEATGFQQLQRPPGYDSIRATGISSDGRSIVGWGENESTAGIWTILWDNGVPMEIPPVGDSGAIRAVDVNNDGVICGYIDHPSEDLSQFVGFRVSADGFELVPDTDDQYSRAQAIDNAGRIVGYYGIDGTAFLWHGNEVSILPAPDQVTEARAHCLNNRDLIGGDIRLPKEEGRGTPTIPVTWAGDQMGEILSSVPGCGATTVIDIADTEQMLGICVFAGPTLWVDRQPIAIGTLVAEPSIIGVVDANALDNEGRIAVVVVVNIEDDIITTSALLTPVGSAPSDINYDCTTDVRDLLLLLQHWGDEGSFADVDRDGQVNVFDLFELLAGWG